MEIKLPEGKDAFTPDEVKTLIEAQVETLIQPKIDSIVQDRLGREKQKYIDYDELKKFKDEHSKKIQADEQKKLEEQGKYEEALKANQAKLDELNGVITTKDQTINSMMIGNALTNEIVTQGGYLEESLALLKASAQLKDGVVVIKGKDANNLEKDFTVADGVKNFLGGRPHLVKTKVNTGGGGTGAGGDAGNTGGAGSEDLTALNDMLTKQTFANDFKGAQETKAKIKAYMTAKGLTISGGVA